MLGVFVLDSFAITRHENFHRGMRVAGRALVKSSFNMSSAACLPNV